MEERNTSINFVRSCLRSVVRNNKIAASRLSRSFFPDKRTIRNYITKYSFEKKKSKIDQEAVSLRIDEWAKSGRVFYRPFRKLNADIEPLLFCFQAHWQDDFFSNYGSTVLMDATYKTTKYSLPLFLLVARTNVNFSPIGFFIVQHEDTRSIAEALKVFRSWNPNWIPLYFMVDFSEAEINAINTVFREPDNVEIKICSFHREQAWERWTKKAGNLSNKADKDAILKLWRNVAKSQDLNTLNQNLNILQNNEEYMRNEKAQRYFESTWMSVQELWVIAFFDKNFLINLTTNNGIESQNKLLKHSFLKNHTDKSLSNILEVIIEDYIPAALSTFEIANTKISESYRRYNEEIPTFLRNRPYGFIKHMYNRFKTAQNIYRSDWIKIEEENRFQVRSETDPHKWYQVSWNEPSCECSDFVSHRLPCKHFCAIMCLLPSYPFDSLPVTYLSNPFFNIDKNYNLLKPISCDESNVNLQQEECFTFETEDGRNNERNCSVKCNKITLKNIREINKKISDITYCIEPDEELEDAEEWIQMLNNIMNGLEKKVKKKENLCLLPKKI